MVVLLCKGENILDLNYLDYAVWNFTYHIIVKEARFLCGLKR